MPSGRYVVLGHDGETVGSEDFRCAPGPAGWRYFSDVKTVEPSPHDAVVDIAVDSSWRPVRLRIETGAHTLLLQMEGDLLTGYRDGAQFERPWDSDMYLSYGSPAFDAIACRRHDASAEIETMTIAPLTLEIGRTTERYELVGVEQVETKAGVFDAMRWRVASEDLAPADLWCAEDVVVRFAGRYELTAYEAGASGVRPRPAT
jgi:hypothetical protein